LIPATDSQEVFVRVFDTSGAPAPPSVHGAASAPARRSAGRDTWRLASLSLRVAGALSLLAVGAVHLQQYFTLYSSIPTIGTLFVLNFVGATAIGLGLLAPVERVVGRLGGALPALLALGGVGLAATSFVFLFVSERTPLFGFMEPGYDPAAILASRVAEAVTVLFLGGFLALWLTRGRAAGRG
jgi:hypothetical protein